jgi:hypothetical protein
MVRVLTPEGHLLVSLFDAFGREQSDCWEHLQAVCEVVDMMALTKLGSQVTWRIAMLHPLRPADQTAGAGESIPRVEAGRGVAAGARLQEQPEP